MPTKYLTPEEVLERLYQEGRVSRVHADYTFLAAMEESKYSVLSRLFKFYWVRLWGWGLYGQYRRGER